MPKMSAFEPKTRFGKLLHRVERGEAIVITRHDRPIARVVREGATEPRFREAVLSKGCSTHSQTQPGQVRTLEFRAAIGNGRK